MLSYRTAFSKTDLLSEKPMRCETIPAPSVVCLFVFGGVCLLMFSTTTTKTKKFDIK